ncbi:hypothetical protein E2C01_095769 [Portunus trituberculatus]|uniref:Uncharacterized protein n=1 Tax=Portunus trituberculatus TaxID=210409 RepID=A0A5B7K094_PORTR|nr:hypothetical protein [Portunus trituberculatus]
MKFCCVSPSFFSPLQLLTLYKGLIRPWWNQKFFVLSTPLLCLQPLSQHFFLLPIIVILMLTALLILLNACLPTSCDLAVQGFLVPLIPILSNHLIQELTSTLNHLYFSLVNSATP